jgi:PAS domain S-box-containing protein
MRQNFRLRALLITAIVGSNILFLTLSGFSLYNSRLQYVERAEIQILNVAKAVDLSLSNSIEKIDLALHTVADELERQLATGGIDEAAMNAFIARQEKRLPEVEAFRVADAQGRVILGKGLDKNAGVHWTDRDYFQYHRDHTDKALQISKPVMGRVAKKHIVGFAQRYNAPDGRFAGVISAPIAVSHFTQLLSGFQVGPNGTLVLRDAKLGLITRIPAIPDKPAGQVGDSSVSPELRKLYESGVNSATYFTPKGADGFERLLSFNRQNKAPMFLFVGAASNDYLAGWNTELTNTASIAFGYLVFSLLTGGFILHLLRNAERSAEALAERELRLKTIIENEPDCIKVVDAEGRLLEMNPAGLAIIEANSIAEVCQLPVLELIAPKDREAFAEMHRQVVSGHPAQLEFEVIGLKGNRRWLETHAVPMQDHGQTTHLAITRDISRRKQDETELEQYRRQLEQLVEQRTTALLETEARASHILQSSADGLYGIDVDGFITFINQAACKLLGYSQEQAIGQNAHRLFHHHRNDGSAYPLSECKSHNALSFGHTIRVVDEVYWHADGHAIPVMYAVHPMLQEGKTIGAVVSFVDMSEQRAATEARERALVAAENLARMRSQFLANMSHEIRTPLNGVLGFAEIGLRHYQNSEKTQDALRKIILSGKRLLGVINDVLDFSKIEAGKLNIEQTEVHLRDLVEHSLDLVRERAEAKQLHLTVALAPNLPEACISDPLRIGQVLLNVLSNAIKFTEQGEVALSLTQQGEMLVFRVSDTGIGMNEEQLADLFNPFTQADASTTRRFGGTGLGLAISKRILELMQGDIRVESQPQQGTSVEFRLPCHAIDLPTAKQEPEKA